MSYVPLNIPLTNGLTENVSDLDARRPGIARASNVDFNKTGEVIGRYGLTARSQKIELRNYNPALGNSLTEQTLATTMASDFYFTSMFRYKDSQGERPGIYALGRTWTYEDDHWSDRLYAAATKVERIAEFKQFITGPAAPAGSSTVALTTFQHAAAYNFYQGEGPTPTGSALLAGRNPSVDAYLPGAGKVLYGAAADVLSGTDVYHCEVGIASTEDVLRLVVRKNNDLALTSFVINFAANDAAVPSIVIRSNDPRCHADQFSTAIAGGVPVLWVSYQLKATNDLKILRVNALTGAIITSVTHTTGAVVKGHWIDVHSVGNRLTLVYTLTGTNGLLCRSYNATTLVLNAAANATLSSGLGFAGEGPCVCGGLQSTGLTTFVAFTEYTDGAALSGDTTSVIIGGYQPIIASAFLLKIYYGFQGGGGPEQTWTIMHQPLRVGPLDVRSRTIMGLVWSPYKRVGTASGVNKGGTWYGVDLTELTGGTRKLMPGPGLFARGTTRTTMVPFGPASAVPDLYAPDPTNPTTSIVGGYRFPSATFTNFSGDSAFNPTLGLNQVSLIQPKSATVGEETVLSGSVPHAIARGYAFEVGFTMAAPETSSFALVATGLFTTGTYAVQALWSWIDEAGVVHRSAPSISRTTTIATALGSFSVGVHNPQLTEREYGQLNIELYVTATNPTATSPKYLHLVQPVTPNAANTVFVGVGVRAIDTTALILYTSSGEFVNTPVSAHAGVATVNRRMWMSDGKTVFASKVFKSNNLAPAWNDEGVLQVVPPAPAGRVVSLENMDDKLVILCERGILVSQGDGPDNSGSGPDFLFPMTVSSLGVSSSQASVTTSRGVVFHSNNTTTDPVLRPGSGGIYLLDRGMTANNVGLPAMNEWTSGSAQLAYVPERELLLVNNYQQLDATGTPYMVALFLRTGDWATWTNPTGRCFGLTEAAGVLWAGFQAGSFAPVVGSYDRSDGKDSRPGFADNNITMSVTTNNIFANGSDGLGWSRVRSIRLLGDYTNAFVGPIHTVTIAAVSDIYRTAMTGTFPFTGPAVTTWPSDRTVPEYRLPDQKASQIKVTCTATPAVAKWAALRLDILPTRKPAPTKNRA